MYDSQIFLQNMISYDLNHHCIQFYPKQNWYVELFQINILTDYQYEISFIRSSQNMLNLQIWWKMYDSQILFYNMISYDLNHHCIQFYPKQNSYVELSQFNILRHYLYMISYIRSSKKCWIYKLSEKCRTWSVMT